MDATLQIVLNISNPANPTGKLFHAANKKFICDEYIFSSKQKPIGQGGSGWPAHLPLRVVGWCYQHHEVP